MLISNNCNFGFFQLCIVLIAVIGVMVYRIAVSAAFFQFTTESQNKTLKANARLLISLSAAVINLIIIVILNKVK